MISDPAVTVADGSMVAFISSWAMHPTLVATVSPNRRWSTVEQVDSAAEVECVGEDRSVHIQAVGHEGAQGIDIMRFLY